MEQTYPLGLPSCLARPLAALGLLLAATGAVQAQTPAVSFAAATTYSSGGADPFSIAVADVNADGKPDMLTVNYTSASARVLLGRGNGTFQLTSSFNSTGNGYPCSIAVADVNADGKPDLLTANSNYSGTVGVLLGNGNGTFQPVVPYSAGISSDPRGIAVADVNADGKPDLLTANMSTTTAGVLLGNGNGTFRTATTYGTKGRSEHIAVADVNADGKPDLLTANFLDNTASVLLGNGNGTFQTATTYGTGTNSWPQHIAVADVNADGKPDLLTANSNNSTVGVLLGNGNGTFQAIVPYSTGTYSSPGGIAVADMNGDGQPDLITTDGYGGTALVLLGNGTGTFQAATSYGVGTNIAPIDLAVADVNGDGRLDVLTANYSNTLSVLLNTSVYAAPTLTSVGPNPTAVGSSVTLTGTNLTGATAVTFTSSGGVATAAPAGYVVASSTSITGVVVPPGLAPGLYTLTVTTPSGTSNGLSHTITAPAGPLPVALTQFVAAAEGVGAVRLAWVTASEKNSHSFEVERSIDGGRFAAIGTVAAAGTTATKRTYALRDAALPAGASVLYYRLRQVDLDGTAHYSPVRVVALGGGAAALFPNPAHGTATLTGVAAGQAVQVLDALGRLVLMTTADAAGTATLALPAGLPGGVYVVRAGQQALRLTVE